MAQPWYTTREVVKAALDIKETARSNNAVDRAIASASRAIEGYLHRHFYPLVATRRFDWPSPNRSRSWRLWLDQHELISVTSLVAGGVTIPDTDYLLYPTDGPPYSRIEIDLDSSSAFASGDTHQQAIVITGVYGYRADEEQVGELTGDLDADADDDATLTWMTADIGVGDILRIGSERMIVTGRSMVDSSQNLGANLAAQANDVTVSVSNGSAFAVDEVLLVGSERMLIVDIAGNSLTVKRAWDGSVLAAHTSGADIYRLAGVQLDRAQLGTTLAAHTSGAAVYRHVVPGLIGELCVALATSTLMQRQAGWARTAGSGEAQREVTGRGLAQIRKDAYAAYGRKARIRGV
jgi:hypothetical protein